MMDRRSEVNVDTETVGSFGAEWSRYDQRELAPAEAKEVFEDYFRVFPWRKLPRSSEGFDMGCGSGRWARFVAPRVGRLNCIDPSPGALQVARDTLEDMDNCELFQGTTSDRVLPAASQDFGYSLGVLHHIPDTEAALQDCVALLKPSAPFLLYLYYRFDNRPWWFRAVWRCSEGVRRIVSRLPESLKWRVTDFLAAVVYWPLARICWLLERVGLKVENLPLAYYRNRSLYVMRTDSRDRFGTPLEQRFSREEIASMMKSAGLEDIHFSPTPPFWVAVGKKTA